MTVNLQAIHDELVLVAYEAGRMMLSANPANIDTGTKLNCTPRPACPASKTLSTG